jgi:hypothetical protein
VSQPQQDPVGAHGPNGPDADMAAAIARLAQQITGLRDLSDHRVADLRHLFDHRVDSLEAVIEAKLDAHRAIADAQADKVALALASSDKAVAKAETATEKRFEGVNEFRAQLNDQARTFMPRTESDASALRMAERIQELTDRMNRAEGHGAGAKDNKAGLYAALAAVAVLLSIVVVVANIISGNP